MPDPSREPTADSLLFELLEAPAASAPSVDSLCARHPQLADELRARVKALREVGLFDSSPRATQEDAPAPPERLGDFRLLERLGAGGMGVVYRARQESLGRDVAIKLVRPEMLWFEDAGQRFQREVETVARMSHPSIATVFSVGEEAGLPYFAMELVSGASLEQALAELAGERPANLRGADLARAIRSARGEPQDPDAELATIFEGSFEQTCLRIAQQLAEALEHAHRRGVVHRDVKPSNVMLTTEGRVLLVDFGLSAEDGPSDLTRTGTIAGSLPFLAPELFTGARPDRRSDIYALGVTLYRMLSLRLPFESATPLALQAAIQAAPPPPLRQLNPRASWEAETLCMVAMERAPVRRYQAAAEVAADIERALDGRALVARRPGPLLRLRRWTRRHPAAALAAVIALTVPSFIAWREHRASAALEERYRESRAVVDRMLTRFARGEVRLAGGYRVGHEVLEEAIRFYERFARERPDDLDAVLQLARARRQEAESYITMGQLDDARRAIDASRELLGRVGQADPDNLRALNLRAELCNDEARALLFRGERDAADAAARRGLELVARLGPQHGNHARLSALLLGDRAQAALDPEATRQWAESSLSHMERALERTPDDAGLRYEHLALSCLGARTLNSLGQREAARDRVLELLEIARGYVERFDGDVRLRSGTAQLLETLGDALIEMEGGAQQALEAYRAALELYLSALEEDPDVSLTRVHHLRCLLGLGRARHGLGDRRGAAEAFEEVVRTAQASAWHPLAASTVAASFRNLASMRTELGEPDALETCNACLAWLERHAADLTEADILVHDVQSCRAECLMSLGRWDEGASMIRTVLDGPTRPAGEIPDRLWAMSWLGTGLEAARAAGVEPVDLEAQALEALFEAVDLGFDDATKLTTDPSFAYLRGHADFQRVVEDLSRD